LLERRTEILIVVTLSEDEVRNERCSDLVAVHDNLLHFVSARVEDGFLLVDIESSLRPALSIEVPLRHLQSSRQFRIVVVLLRHVHVEVDDLLGLETSGEFCISVDLDGFRILVFFVVVVDGEKRS